MPNIRQFYKRIDPKVDLNSLFPKLSAEFNLGKYMKWELIPYGYSDFNVKLQTTKGHFFVKLFSKHREKEEIVDIVNRFLTLYKNEIPVARVYSIKGEYLYTFNNTYLSVMEYIDGLDFTKTYPSLEDIKKATEILAKINKLNFKIRSTYDSWGTKNLIPEYEKRKKFLSEADLSLIRHVVEEFKQIDFSDFHKSIIHGDFHGEHFFKDKKGRYWVIDLETMDFTPSVIDLAIFLATFPLNRKNSLASNKSVYSLVLSEYLKHVKLSEQEIISLPSLIKATYAIYLIRSNYEKVVNKDLSKQTEYWLEWGRRGLNYKLLTI